MSPESKTVSERKAAPVPILFFTLTYCWAWVPWIVVILAGKGTPATTSMVVLVAGSVGPSLAGIAVTYLHRDSSEGREFWSRAFDPRRLTLSTGLIAIAFPLAISGVVAILIGITGSNPFAVQPAGFLGLALFSLFSGPLNEELGWRGYALEPMQNRFGPELGSTILGAIWAAWHLPLFFFPGAAQVGWGFGPFGFWAFAVTFAANSVVMATIYNRTRRSTLSGIGYHWAFNFSTTALAGTPMRVIWAVISGVIAIALLVTRKVGAPEGSGPQSATRKPMSAFDSSPAAALPADNSQ